MKKIIALVLSALCLLALCACGDSAADNFYIPDFTPREIEHDIDMMAPVNYLDPPILGMDEDGNLGGGNSASGGTTIDLILWSQVSYSEPGIEASSSDYEVYALTDTDNTNYPYIAHSRTYRAQNGYRVKVSSGLGVSYSNGTDADITVELLHNKPDIVWEDQYTALYTMGDITVGTGNGVAKAVIYAPLNDGTYLREAATCYGDEAINKLASLCYDGWGTDIMEVISEENMVVTEE